MDDLGYTLDKPTFQRLERALRETERHLPIKPHTQSNFKDVADPIKWFPCQGDSPSLGATPAYAAVRLSSATVDAAGIPILVFTKPTQDSQTGCGLVWHAGVPAPDATPNIGRCTFEPWWALYDPATTPSAGDNLGTVAGEWYLRPGNTGYKCLAVGNGRALVRPTSLEQTEQLLRVELTSSLTMGGSATAELVEFDGTDWSTTGTVVTVYDSLGRFEGSNGDRFWVTPKGDSERLEIISPGGSVPTKIVWAGQKTSTLSYTGSTATWLTLTEVFTGGDMSHSTAAGYSVVTVPTAGYYKLSYGYRMKRPATYSDVTLSMMFPEQDDGSGYNVGAANSWRAEIEVFPDHFNTQERWSVSKQIVVSAVTGTKFRLQVGSENSTSWDLLSAHFQIERFDA